MQVKIKNFQKNLVTIHELEQLHHVDEVAAELHVMIAP